jgi:hypothetical protein
MWKRMVDRGDGVLRLPAQAIELGGVLAERADAFLSNRPGAEDQLRRILTLKLATMRADGDQWPPMPLSEGLRDAAGMVGDGVVAGDTGRDRTSFFPLYFQGNHAAFGKTRR